MAEYIERSDAAVFFENSKQTMWHKDDIAATISSKKNIPSADVAEVVHGKWMVNRSPVEVEFRCSKCNYSYIEADPNQKCDYNYCPICGAKMDANSKNNLPESTRQTVLYSFMKGSED